MDTLKLVTNYRRQLHRIPEVSRQLPKTKEYIKFVLSTLDCEITEVMESGLCAYFDRGMEATTAFRADMDALPIQEANKIDFASLHEGKMHACGHDGHMAMVLALARYVDTQKELPCNVLLVFQPAEETTGGAKEICSTGILEKYNVDRIFGCHLWPFAPLGSISSRSGAMMPKSAQIDIDITGKSSHATDPDNGVDALFLAVKYIQRVYENKEKNQRPDPAPDQRTILQICKMESGTARNIISGHTELVGTVRAFTEEDFDWLISILKEEGHRLEQEYNCKVHVRHSEGYPPVYNTPELYSQVLPVLKTLNDFIEMPEPAMISEDYSYYGQRVPSIFFFVGLGNGLSLHSKDFNFDEEALVYGVQLYKKLLFA